MAKIGKRAYAEMFGPTVGDRVRLADTALLVEVEADYTLRAGSYGEEVKFGGGKTIRDGMAQSQKTRAGAPSPWWCATPPTGPSRWARTTTLPKPMARWALTATRRAACG